MKKILESLTVGIQNPIFMKMIFRPHHHWQLYVRQNSIEHAWMKNSKSSTYSFFSANDSHIFLISTAGQIEFAASSSELLRNFISEYTSRKVTCVINVQFFWPVVRTTRSFSFFFGGVGRTELITKLIIHGSGK